MTETVASAPGKLILLGEYAVLEGAPAVVLAVDRHARVTVKHGVSRNRIDAPQAGATDIGFKVTENGTEFATADPALSERLALVGTVLAAARPASSLHIVTDTSDFYDHGAKMGFGSSAALTVAAYAALTARRPSLDRVVELHRAAQHGRGSGCDVAASLNGGVQAYRIRDAVETMALQLPADLHWRCVWTGKSASTTSFIRGLEQAEHRRAAMAALTDSARARVAELGDTAQSWVHAIQEFTIDLQHFARQTALPVFAGGHEELMALGARVGVVYKPSGAGGGDIGVALSTDGAAMAAFSAALDGAGARLLDPGLDRNGLTLG
ncbi:MAG: hypothetical protein KJO54_02815 [Gammaproteobacteria bacterium]|nr:hypothetical protein [Gammaproteobacteria bacterium]NNM20123.1 hypothetical protein [Gammaproteobacteria bacterium]